MSNHKSVNMRKFLIAALTFATTLGVSAADPGFYNPDDVNDADWYDWTDWTTAHIAYGSFHGGFEEDGVQLQKRVARDASVTKYQVKIMGYFTHWDLIFEYDPENQEFSFPVQYFGVDSYYYDGAKLLISGYKEYWGEEDPYSSFDEEEGIINLYSVCYYEGLEKGQEYAKGVDVLKLDGYTKYDVDILTDECVYTYDHKVKFEFTQHPHGVCYELLQGLATESKIDLVATEKKNPLDASAEVEFTLSEGLNTIVVISYDKQETRYVSLKEIYCMPSDDDNWKHLGTGRFTEDAITGLGSDMVVSTYDVEIDESLTRPGYYRMVNPYDDFVAGVSDMSIHESHTHYIYFDASEPSQVMLKQGITGVTHPRLGMMYLTSKAYEGMMAGQLKVEYASYFGVLEDGKITFPKEAIGVKLPSYYDGIYWVNNTGKFSIELPAGAGVEEVAVEDNAAPAEYYNLQGIKVTNPENGKLYIRRCAGKTDKVVYHD